MMAYVLLFLSAFGAATLLPLQSETVLAGFFLLGRHSELLLILVATVGNVPVSYTHLTLPTILLV